MANVTDTIRERIKAVNERLDTLRAEMTKAETENADLQTTLRVLAEVTGEEVPSAARVTSPTSTRPASEKKRLMFDVLDVGANKGVQPVEVYKALVAAGIEDISIQIVRTTLWRSAQKGEIASDNGRYWKIEAEEPPFFNDSSAYNSSAGITTGETKHDDRTSGRNASPDVPSSRNGEVVHEVG